jgi:hypothetical protein
VGNCGAADSDLEWIANRFEQHAAAGDKGERQAESSLSEHRSPIDGGAGIADSLVVVSFGHESGIQFNRQAETPRREEFFATDENQMDTDEKCTPH